MPLLRVGRDFLRYALGPNCPQVVDWQAWRAFSIPVCYPAFEGGSGRMILKATAGPICALTPRMIENYSRMIDVWEELSPIED